MVKTKELSEDIRSAIISKHKSSKGYKAISKDIGIPVSTVCNIIKKFAKHGTVKNVPGRREKRKIDENSSKVGANGGKSTTSNIQRPEGQPGTVWGHGFNKYTKPSRASWVKAKENTIAEDKTVNSLKKRKEEKRREEKRREEKRREEKRREEKRRDETRRDEMRRGEERRGEKRREEKRVLY
ncbi:hypothetical protein QTP86_018398 [Hemibagrus guttatus]|nr:hypothetical protein QTP86_018398 [Hemibagrus guttatus]